MEDAHLKVALMSIGNGHSLELIQYVQPTGAARPTDERNHLGASHLAFNVVDIEQTFEHLVSHGAQGLNPPVEVMLGRKVCYLQDPDRNWIELLEINE